ncbi:MAG: YgiQ family radical SAM protein [Deltaproteobacteria bacterium]|nr:YgiQ family radical SAM protein [Deltaproteobacteria bacterium]
MLFRRSPYRVLAPATFLPTTRAEMDALGWDACDVVLVTGDAYVDHPSFGMALVGRLLESQGFRVGILSQPDWHSAEPFRALGRPRLYFGVTGGNMDSMVNRYTSDRRLRSDDAYTPDGEAAKRPDRAVIVYAQRCREAFAGVPVVIGGIESSLRRIAHYDYWSEKVRRSILFDAKADILLYGNAERALVDLTWRLAEGEAIGAIRDLRGTAFAVKAPPADWKVIDSTSVDTPGPVEAMPSPYQEVAPAEPSGCDSQEAAASAPAISPSTALARAASTPLATPSSTPTAAREAVPKNLVAGPRMRVKAAIRLPDFEAVAADPILYAHASRVLHREANPHNARALVQRHGDRDLWVNPPPIPLTTPEMDFVYERPFARVPHPKYGGRPIPAYQMIRFSVTIQRGCFGGCSFCSITEHEGRIIQNRSEESILGEVAALRDGLPGFTGVVSDLGGPTANMYRIACKSREIEAACRKPSCVYPSVCENLATDHSALIALYRKARQIPGIKKVLIASGVRYDLAVEDPRYVKELVTHHVGGYLKIAPEHLAEGPLSKMMKPGMGKYYEFKRLFEKYSAEAGKKQYLIPYFIAAHPGTTEQDMLELALWLKQNGFKTDQVQTFLPSPMATATAMYHSGKNPLRKVTRDSEPVHIPLGLRTRRVHKAFLRWHAPESWPILREALVRMGRADLIGDGPEHLIPREGSPAERRALAEADTIERGKRFQTQHTGVENAARPSTAGAPPRRSEAGRKGPPGAKGGPPQGSRKR